MSEMEDVKQHGTIRRGIYAASLVLLVTVLTMGWAPNCSVQPWQERFAAERDRSAFLQDRINQLSPVTTHPAEK